MIVIPAKQTSRLPGMESYNRAAPAAALGHSGLMPAGSLAVIRAAFMPMRAM
jgi:hypothetical protein